ncbi:MAG: DsrE family protein [Hyphomicrobiales bacterium]|nr:DsrE family protein [Hyphomicrobiales bacterium]
MKLRIAVSGFCLALAASGLGYRAYAGIRAQDREAVRQQLASLHFAPFARQKVVYHITGSGGWFAEHYFHVLGSIKNHLDAVGGHNIDLRVVLQARGIALLEDAESNAALAHKIDALRRRGVRFLVCRNSLIGGGVEPSRLYGLKKSDIVEAGVAEVAALEARGFVYLKM